MEAYRTKKGPNGHSLSTSAIDAQALPQNLVKSLIKMGGPHLDFTLNYVMRNQNFLYYYYSRFMKVVSSSNIIRRLSYFPDKEGKTRVIGILD